MLPKDQAETDRSHGHAGDPQPYLQHREHQEAPDDVAAGAHPGSVIVPTRSAPKAKHSPPPQQTFVSSLAAEGESSRRPAAAQVRACRLTSIRPGDQKASRLSD